MITRKWMRFSLLSVLVALSVVAVCLGSTIVTKSDQLRAAQQIIAWISEGTRIPGYPEDYPDHQLMLVQKQFFVVCEFLPEDCMVSSDPRIQRISEQDYDRVFEQHRFDDTAYITIEIKEHSSFELRVEVSCTFGSLAGHGYEMSFRKRFFAIVAKNTEMIWVS